MFQVEQWVMEAGDELVGLCWDELKYIRQAVAFLVLHAKQKKTLKEIQTEMCPELSVQQLYRISTMYWDDKYNTETVSGEVLQEMRSMMQVLLLVHALHLLRGSQHLLAGFFIVARV
jgi:myosin V